MAHMMDIEEDPDISLSIPLKSLYEEFCCPICFTIIEDCFSTPCGHNFCGRCIKECLNRKHACPSCNRETTVDRLYKNHHHDRIVVVLQTEKDVASKQYFEQLIKQSTQPQESPKMQPKESREFSPIEDLFHRHLRKSLGVYEEYYQQLYAKHEKSRKKLEDDARMESLLAKQEAILNKKDIPQSNGLPAISIQELDGAFKQSVDALMESYQTWLETVTPPPAFLPLSLSVSIPSKQINISKLVLKSVDTLNDLKQLVAARCVVLNQPIKDWTGAKFSYKDETGKFIELSDDLCPIHQYSLQQAVNLQLEGAKFLMDMPKQCFSATFDKENPGTMDYYTCKDCKINWVCKPCMESCHKGHNVCEYIVNHKPTWACCYCVKMKKCTIENSKSKV